MRKAALTLGIVLGIVGFGLSGRDVLAGRVPEVPERMHGDSARGGLPDEARTFDQILSTYYRYDEPFAAPYPATEASERAPVAPPTPPTPARVQQPAMIGAWHDRCSPGLSDSYGYPAIHRYALASNGVINVGIEAFEDPQCTQALFRLRFPGRYGAGATDAGGSFALDVEFSGQEFARILESSILAVLNRYVPMTEGWALGAEIDVSSVSGSPGPDQMPSVLRKGTRARARDHQLILRDRLGRETVLNRD